MPPSEVEGSLEHDAELVKAALLYADRVTLVSPSAWLLDGLTGFTEADSRERRDALARLTLALPGAEEDVAVYEDLKRRKGRLRGVERVALARFEKLLSSQGDEMASTVQGLFDQAGMPELQRALAAGVLDIHPLAVQGEDERPSADEVIDRFVAVLAKSVSGPAGTYPLFDDGAGGLVESMVAEGLITDARSARSNQVGVAGRFIGEIEAFPDAEMDVVLDVRKKLRAPLIRFRAALARISADVESPAWKPEEFAREAEELYHRHVAPALVELEESLLELGALTTLRRVMSDQKTVVSSAAFAIATGTGIGIPHLPHIIFGGSAAASFVAAGFGEAQQRRDIQQARERNDFYFLYEANRQLRG